MSYGISGLSGQQFGESAQGAANLYQKKLAYKSLSDLLENQDMSHGEKQSKLFQTLYHDPQALKFGLDALGKAPEPVSIGLKETQTLVNQLAKESEKGVNAGLGGDDWDEISSLATRILPQYGGDKERAINAAYKIWSQGTGEKGGYEQPGPHEGNVPESYRASHAPAGEQQTSLQTTLQNSPQQEPSPNKSPYGSISSIDQWMDPFPGLAHQFAGGLGKGIAGIGQILESSPGPGMGFVPKDIAKQVVSRLGVKTQPSFADEAHQMADEWAGPPKSTSEQIASKTGEFVPYGALGGLSGALTSPLYATGSVALQKLGVPEQYADMIVGFLGAGGHFAKGKLGWAKKTASTMADIAQKTGQTSEQIRQATIAKAKQQGFDLGTPQGLQRTVRALSDEGKGYSLMLDVPEKGSSLTEQIASERLTDRPVEGSLEYEAKYGADRPARKITALTEVEMSRSKEASGQLQETNERLAKAQETRGKVKARMENPRTSEANKPKLQQEINRLDKKIEDLKEEQRIHRHVEKTGRDPGQTKFSLEEGANTRVQEHLDAARNPETTASQDFLGRMDREMHLLEDAGKSFERGELSAEGWTDAKTRPLDAYAKAYEAKIAQIEANMKNAEASHGESIHAQRAEANRALKSLKQNLALNRAERAVHMEKLKTAGTLRGAKGKLLRQALKKDLGHIKRLQKQFVKDMAAVDVLQQKTQQQGLKLLHEAKTQAQSTKAIAKLFGVTEQQASKIPVALDNLATNPSPETSKAAADATGLPADELHSTSQQAEKLANEYSPTKEWAKKAKDYLNSKKYKLMAGVGWYMLQRGVEETTGEKLPAFIGVGLGAHSVAVNSALRYVEKMGNVLYLNSKRNEFSKLKSGPDRTRYLKKLAGEGWTTKQIKEIAS